MAATTMTRVRAVRRQPQQPCQQRHRRRCDRQVEAARYRLGELFAGAVNSAFPRSQAAPENRRRRLQFEKIVEQLPCEAVALAVCMGRRAPVEPLQHPEILCQEALEQPTGEAQPDAVEQAGWRPRKPTIPRTSVPPSGCGHIERRNTLGPARHGFAPASSCPKRPSGMRVISFPDSHFISRSARCDRSPQCDRKPGNVAIGGDDRRFLQRTAVHRQQMLHVAAVGDEAVPRRCREKFACRFGQQIRRADDLGSRRRQRGPAPR